MEYEYAHDLQKQTIDIVRKLGLDYIDLSRVSCVRGRGSQARGVIARIHSLAKAMQIGMGVGAHYVIEFLEPFEKCSEKEKIETIIHELLHIPKSFGGGFRHHDYVRNKKVKEMYKKYIQEEKNKNLELFTPIQLKSRTS